MKNGNFNSKSLTFNSNKDVVDAERDRKIVRATFPQINFRATRSKQD